MTIKETGELTFNGVYSDKIYIDSRVVCSIIIPNDSSFNSKTLSIEVEVNKDEYAPLYDSDGNQAIIYIGANRFIAINILDYIGIANIRFVASGSLDTKKIKVVIADILR